MIAPPEDCPDCGRVLYPFATLRPIPSFTILAKLLFLFGSLTTSGIYFAGIILIRSIVWIPMILLGVLWFPVALIPALIIALIAYRLPKRLCLRCTRCGWKGQFVCMLYS